MGENLANALTIALIGMGLILAAILVFWLLISATTRLAAGRPRPQAGEEPEEAAATDGSAPAEREIRRQAALAAVAVALARDRAEGPRPFPLPPPVLVSTWQSVNRARQLAQRRSVR